MEQNVILHSLDPPIFLNRGLSNTLSISDMRGLFDQRFFQIRPQPNWKE